MKNFTAIILAAGRGRRMGELTADKPKGLIRVAEKSLLEHTIDFVNQAGAKEIIVVAGFYADKVKALADKLGTDIKVVVNNDYKKQNLTSVAEALKVINKGNIFICNVDYIKTSNVIEAVKNNQKALAAFASFDNLAATDEMKIKVNDRGDLVDISKKLIDYDAIYSGDFYLSAEYLEDWKEAVGRAIKNYGPETAVTEHAFIEMRDMGYDIAVVNVGPTNWLEIDTPEELAKANETLAKARSLESVACNLCSQTDDEVIYKNSQLTVVMCQHCTLAYLNPRSSDESYIDYYQNEYQKTRHDIFDYDQAIQRLESRNSYVGKKEQVDFMREFVSGQSRVFEVGTGWGTLLKRLRDEVCCQVEGIEVSQQAVEVARTYYDLAVMHQSFEDYLRLGAGNKYDLVIMHHVLEHFADPKHILTKLKDLLNPQAYVYIAVPNIMSPDEPLERYFRLVHTYYFSPKTIYELLAQVGYKIIKFDARRKPQEMRLIAVKNSHSAPALPDYVFNVGYEKDKILEVLRRQEIKYKILRSMKKTASRLLPEKYFAMLRRQAINVLKKMGLIKV